MKILPAIAILFALNASAQVTVDTLVLPQEESLAMQHDDLFFPIITTGNKPVDVLINTDLINRFTGNEYPGMPADSTLIKWGDNQLFSLGFEVTLNKNGLLSLNISAESCGAHCTGWTSYFTYSASTGKFLGLGEIADTTGKFREIVLAEKNKQYDQASSKLKSLMNEELEYDYNHVMEYYNACNQSFDLGSFALYPDHLQIIDQCFLPNAIKSLTPAIELRYNYSDIRKYIKLKDLY